MNTATIVGLGIAAAIILIGIENNQEGPIWLGVLITSFVVSLRVYALIEDYIVSKIEE